MTPPRLSGGERQRLAIARALANDPSIILADEPTGNLDSAAVDRLLALFRRIRDEHGVTILLATHDMHVASAADRIVYMRDGRIVESAAAGGASRRLPAPDQAVRVPRLPEVPARRSRVLQQRGSSEPCLRRHLSSRQATAAAVYLAYELEIDLARRARGLRRRRRAAARRRFCR